MGMRELVILLVGFAIVAVVLRGLYVALKGRRGQIRMAIDKNIPQDVDLDSLDMSELPGGGARTITRSLEQVNLQNSAFSSAQARAVVMDLGDGTEDEVAIPVLMDAVALGEENTASPVVSETVPETVTEVETLVETEELQSEPFYNDLAPKSSESYQQQETEDLPLEDEFAFEDERGAEPAIGAAYFEDDLDQPEEENPEQNDFQQQETVAVAPQSDEQQDAVGFAHQGDEDPDSVLFDYDDDEDGVEEPAETSDSMQSVAPDYKQDEDASDEYSDYEDDFVEDDNSAVAEIEEDDFADDSDDDYLDDSADSYQEYDDSESVEENDAQAAAPIFDPANSLDDFSMTAGERIGSGAKVAKKAEKENLFDEPEERVRDEPKPKRKSLFSLFARKPKPEQEHQLVEPEQQAAPQQQSQSQPELDFEPEPAPEIQLVKTKEAVAPLVQEQEEIIDELEQARTNQAAAPEAVQAPSGPSEVIVINVMARKGRVFAGDDLLHTLITTGLKFGDMNIFHKRLSNDAQGPVIFSVANIMNPGTFDLNNMEEFTTLGISLFLALPSPINNLDAFEQMLDVAQQIIATLDGELKDDHRNGMTAQTIEHYRQRIRDFELLCLRAAGSRA